MSNPDSWRPRRPHIEPDQVRAIPTGTYGKEPQTAPSARLPLSWKEAIMLFFFDNRKNLLIKFGARFAPAVLGFVGFADDATVVGIADEPLTIAFVAWCVWRINKYRKTGK